MRPASSGPLQDDLSAGREPAIVQRAPIGGVAAQFRILGPLERWRRRPAAGYAAKQRALLAVPVHAGQVVSVDRLVEELWGQDLPDTARSLLQVYVAKLRKRLLGDADPATRRGPCVCVA